MPVKIDTRKKTRKQKEKNRRRKKRNQSRKGSLFERIRRSLNQVTGQGPKPPQNPGGARSRRTRPSMQAIHGVVANAYASRMPVGSNHTKGIYANTETGLSAKNFFKRTLRQMKRAQNPDHASLPPTYSYQTRPRPIYPEEIEVQPIGLAQPSKAMSNLFRALPAASIPRGQRFLRQSIARPIATGLAEPGMPNWGQMYEATEAGRPRVTRAMTAAELGKEDAYTRVQADMRTGGPGPTMGIWAPTRVRTQDNVSPRGSVSSRESARKDGRRRLSMAEELAFLTHYPPRTELVATAKTHTPAGQQARAEIRQLIDDVFSNANSSISSHGSTEAYSLTPSERIDIESIANLTPAEIQRLRDLGLENMAPGPEVQGAARYAAIREIRDVFEEFALNSNGSMSTIHTEYSNAEDPLHLTAGEILLLRRQGPQGLEHIRLATSSASAEITMDQVAEARAFLASLRQRSRSRSRSGSRSTLSRSRSGSRSGSSSRRRSRSFSRGARQNEPYNWAPIPGRVQGAQAAALYQAAHAAAFPQAQAPQAQAPEARSASGSESNGSLGSLGLTSNSSFEEYPGTEANLDQAFQNETNITPRSSLGSRGSRGSRSSRGSRGSRGPTG